MEEIRSESLVWMEGNGKTDLLELECENVNWEGRSGELTIVMNVVHLNNFVC